MSYTDTLSSDKDKVRFLISDVSSPFLVSDNEISGTLAMQPSNGSSKPHLAAADIIGVLLTRFATTGKGVSEKQFGDKLRVKFGIGQGSDLVEALERRMTNLRVQANQSNDKFYIRFIKTSSTPA